MSAPIEHFVVLDFEATCDDTQPPVPQEVIEFPSVLVAREGFRVVDAFESFVRPTHHPVLSDFCRALTTITQADVDNADPFAAVLERHTAWLASHGCLSDEGTCFVLCGDWDLGTLFPAQAQTCDPPLATLPRHLRRWMNIKHPFAQHAGVNRAPGMAGMLAHLGLELEGTHHRGIDDCRNIARILAALGNAGALLEPTSRVSPSRYPAVALRLQDPHGSVHEILLKKRALKTLLGLASERVRRAVRSVRQSDGTPVTEESLADLAGGETLVIA